MKRAIGLIVMAAFLFCGIVAGAMFYRQYSDAKSSGDMQKRKNASVRTFVGGEGNE